jgi:hypothetical protein
VSVSIRDPEQIRADIGRWGREIQTCRTRLKLTDDHPEITRRLARIRAAEHLLGLTSDPPNPPHPTCIDVTAIDQTPRSEWICGPECPKEA